MMYQDLPRGDNSDTDYITHIPIPQGRVRAGGAWERRSKSEPGGKMPF